MKVTHLVTEIPDSPRVPLQYSRKKCSARAKTPPPGLHAHPFSLFIPSPSPQQPVSASPPAAAAGFASASGGHAHFSHHYLASSAGSDPHGCCGTIFTPRPRQPQDQKRLSQRQESIHPVHSSGALRPHL